MKTINQVKQDKIIMLKRSFLERKIKEEKIANSNDFIFDRKNLKIIKKGQMNLL